MERSGEGDDVISDMSEPAFGSTASLLPRDSPRQLLPSQHPPLGKSPVVFVETRGDSEVRPILMSMR